MLTTKQKALDESVEGKQQSRHVYKRPVFGNPLDSHVHALPNTLALRQPGYLRIQHRPTALRPHLTMGLPLSERLAAQ